MLKLKSKIDLIQIFKEGKLDEVEEALQEREKLTMRYAFLYEHFQRYFPEIPSCRIYEEEGYLDRSKIYDDELFIEFDNLSKIFAGRRIYRFKKDRLNDFIQDQIGQEFYNKYIDRHFKEIIITTTLQEAVEFNEERLVNLVKSYRPLDPKERNRRNMQKLLEGKACYI